MSARNQTSATVRSSLPLPLPLSTFNCRLSTSSHSPSLLHCFFTSPFSSLISQRQHRIHLHRPSHRHPASHQRHSRQQHRHSEIRPQIKWRHAHQQSLHRVRPANRRHQSHHNPGTHHQSHLPQNHPHDLHRLRAQRHADPNFIRPLSHNVRHHAVSPHRREQQRQRSHRSQKNRLITRILHRVRHELRYRLHIKQRETRIQRFHRLAQSCGGRFRRSRCSNHSVEWPPGIGHIPRQRNISFGHRRVAQTLLLHITNNSDNTKLHEVLKNLPDRALIRPKRLRHRVIDHRRNHVLRRNFCLFFVVLHGSDLADQLCCQFKVFARQFAPIQQRDAHHAKIIRTDRRPFDQRPRHAILLLSGDLHVSVIPASQR